LELGKSGNTSKWMTMTIMVMMMMMIMMKSSSSRRFTTTTTPHNITPSPVLKAWHTAPKEKKQKTEPEEAKQTKNAVQKKFESRRSSARNGKSSGRGGKETGRERKRERRKEVTGDEQSNTREDTITNPWSRHKRGDMALLLFSSLLSSLLLLCLRASAAAADSDERWGTGRWGWVFVFLRAGTGWGPGWCCLCFFRKEGQGPVFLLGSSSLTNHGG